MLRAALALSLLAVFACSSNATQGAKGDPGEQGPTGPTGPQGDAGPTGATGATGPQGEPGPQGSPGEQGPQGLQGAPGMDGAQGAQGLKGDTGAAGQSVTGLSLAAGDGHCPAGGVQYTSADGIHYVCNGPAGDAGPQGLQGLPGSQGATGIQGLQGPAGATGLQGATGGQGPQGVAGAQGLQGPTGAQGTQGPQGNQGIQGIQGIPGVAGDAGVQGPRGLAGQNVTSLGLNIGDINCPNGGVQYTSADGVHFVCNGATGDAGVLGVSGPLQLFQGELSINSASSSSAGVLSSGDYQLFSSKLASVTAGAGLIDGGSGAGLETLAVDFGSGANQATRGNDSRLSDARAPTSGSGFYIQNGATAQSASFNVTGNGQVGGNLTVGGKISGDGTGLTGVALLSSPNATFGGNLTATNVTATGVLSGGTLSLSGAGAGVDFISTLRAGIVIDTYDSFAAFGYVNVPWARLANGRSVLNFKGASALSLPASNYGMLSQNGGGLAVAIWFNTALANAPLYAYYECGPHMIALNMSSHQVNAVYDNNSSRPIVSSPAGVALDDGKWHLSVHVIDPVAGQHRLYIDGVPPVAGGPGIVSTSVTGSLGLSSSYTFALGYEQGVCNPTTYLTGMLDGFRVWQRALTDADVAALYAATEPLYP